MYLIILVVFYAGMLEITAALPSHAGRYTCSARNPAGVAHKHISLTVQGRLQWISCNSFLKHDLNLCNIWTLNVCSFIHLEPPEIRPMAEEVQVLLHHGTVLPCDVQGFPRPSITWQREGVPIATGNKQTTLLYFCMSLPLITFMVKWLWNIETVCSVCYTSEHTLLNMKWTILNVAVQKS